MGAYRTVNEADALAFTIRGNVVGATTEKGDENIGLVIDRSVVPLFSMMIIVSFGCALQESTIPKSALEYDCVTLACSLKPRKLREANELQLDV